MECIAGITYYEYIYLKVVILVLMEIVLGCFCLVSLNHLHLLRNRIPRCVNFVHTVRDCCYAGASNFEFQNFLVLMEKKVCVCF